MINFVLRKNIIIIDFVFKSNIYERKGKTHTPTRKSTLDGTE